MTVLYDDDTVQLDDDGLSIKNSRARGASRRIEYGAIRRVETFEMGFWSGRHRVAGISPGRPRNWFAWERGRSAKQVAVALDVGTWVRPTFTPDDPGAVIAILDERVATS